MRTRAFSLIELEQRGIDLRITNNGHHWQFRKGGRLAEWWPSSAKLVLNKQYPRGVHAHDWLQVMAEIDQQFSK